MIPPTTDERRSSVMRAVKSKDTAPEMQVRRFVHALGYRYRLHRDDLPGKPDLVFPKLKRVIFVHGCFWHGHQCIRGSRVPKTNREYWIRKIERNCRRDVASVQTLRSMGWSTHIVWECQLNGAGHRTLEEIASFLHT
jgi:DNA mismatch endonuclease (patch repair protein)